MNKILKMKNVLMGLLAVLMTATFSCKKNGVDPVPTPPPVDTVPPPAPVSYLTLAKETHGFIAGNLLTQYGSYRANTTSFMLMLLCLAPAILPICHT